MASAAEQLASFLLISSDVLPKATLRGLPDDLADIFGDSLDASTSGQGLVAEGWRSAGETVYFAPHEVDRVARHLMELGCTVLLHVDNVRVEFPGGEISDARPLRLPGGEPGYAIGGEYLKWVEVQEKGRVEIRVL